MFNVLTLAHLSWYGEWFSSEIEGEITILMTDSARGSSKDSTQAGSLMSDFWSVRFANVYNPFYFIFLLSM